MKYFNALPEFTHLSGNASGSRTLGYSTGTSQIGCGVAVLFRFLQFASIVPKSGHFSHYTKNGMHIVMKTIIINMV